MEEISIIRNLMGNEEYTRRTLPYIKPDYFEEHLPKIVFKSYQAYFDTYNGIPTKEALQIMFSNRTDLSQDDSTGGTKFIKELDLTAPADTEFLVNQTEIWCQRRDLYLNINKAIHIYNGEEKNLDVGAIPKLLQDSLAISFDNRIGHNYTNDAEDRFEYYHKQETRIPFDIDILNTITQGGLPIKSLTCFMGGTGTGKSLVMCHMAAANFQHGKHVLYVTLELAEEEIGRRIDANLLDVPVSEIKDMDHDEFTRKIERVKKRSPGSLTIKEFPAAQMNVNHLRHIIAEIKVKQGVTVDIVYLDYINLCSSARVRNLNANSYTIVKSIAEEMRGLAMELGIPIVTATQSNRSAQNNTDVDMSEVSESYGLPMTLDCFIALMTTEELESSGQLLFKQLKNRWGSLDHYRRFTVGIDRSKMRLYNLETSAQKIVSEQKTAETFRATTLKTKKMFSADDIS